MFGMRSVDSEPDTCRWGAGFRVAPRRDVEVKGVRWGEGSGGWDLGFDVWHQERLTASRTPAFEMQASGLHLGMMEGWGLGMGFAGQRVEHLRLVSRVWAATG